MTELEINKIIHEAMGKCWHSFDLQNSHDCLQCGRHYRNLTHPSYTSLWEAYGPMMTDWAWQQKWWGDFVRWLNNGISSCDIPYWMLDCLRGSTAIAEFLEERKP